MNLYAWFPYGASAEVAVPTDMSLENFVEMLISRPASRNVWIDLVDGSKANLSQIVRLQIADSPS